MEVAMGTKRLLFATAVLCLAFFPMEAHGQSLWSWSQWATGLSTPANPSATPSTYLYGNVPSGQTVGEVAVTQAVIRQGDTVPAPTYSDGTSAANDEVFWTASLWRAQFGSAPCIAWPILSDGDGCEIAFSGRTLSHAHAVVMSGGHCVSDFVGWPTDDVQVLVTVVAVRQALPVGTERKTWGSLKLHYR
jgi:hypothetical protein